MMTSSHCHQALLRRLAPGASPPSALPSAPVAAAAPAAAAGFAGAAAPAPAACWAQQRPPQCPPAKQ